MSIVYSMIHILNISIEINSLWKVRNSALVNYMQTSLAYLDWQDNKTSNQFWGIADLK